MKIIVIMITVYLICICCDEQSLQNQGQTRCSMGVILGGRWL